MATHMTEREKLKRINLLLAAVEYALRENKPVEAFIKLTEAQAVIHEGEL